MSPHPDPSIYLDIMEGKYFKAISPLPPLLKRGGSKSSLL
jgi:hypothetical protein